jgi:hypothetical protein
VQRDGTNLPLRINFTADAKDQQIALAEQLRRFIGQPPAANPILAEVEAAVDAGQLVQAAQLLRRYEGFSPLAARQRVEALPGRKKG